MIVKSMTTADKMVVIAVAATEEINKGEDGEICVAGHSTKTSTATVNHLLDGPIFTSAYLVLSILFISPCLFE